MMLLLRAAEAGDSLESGGGVVVCPCAGTLLKPIEHAGHAYQDALSEKYGLHPKTAEQPDEPTAGVEEEAEDLESKQEWEGKRLLAHHTDDYYSLLGLEELRWRATEDEIKKAFRKVSLKYHPDKIGMVSEKEREEAEEHFKKIIKAYDILSDKRKRAAYNSVDEVDDSIPFESEINDESFYEKLGRVFEINARWSTANRMPKLGDDELKYEKVMKFYDAWFNFKSWREFTMNQEYDPDQAECREERRWMERQNAKVAKVAKQEEMARIRQLVELAYKLDPRIRRQKEGEKRAKEQAKEERRRKKEEAERTAREEEERLQQEKAEKEALEREQKDRERKDRDRLKKQLRRTKQRVRLAAESATENSIKTAAAIELICNKMEQTELVAFAEQLEACDPEGRENLIRTTETALESSREAEGNKKDVMNKETKNASSEATAVWTAEEASLLSKALAKFPGGTAGRWNKVAEVIQTKTAAECLAKVNSAKLAASKNVAGKEAAETIPKAAAKEAPKAVTPKPEVAKPAKKAPTAAAAPGDGPPNKYKFSVKQQSALEAAMKKFGAATGDDRWSKVASAVPGKTPEECEKRYKELVSYFRSKKAKK